jgi:hypothetical protein
MGKFGRAGARRKSGGKPPHSQKNRRPRRKPDAWGTLGRKKKEQRDKPADYIRQRADGK